MMLLIKSSGQALHWLRHWSSCFKIEPNLQPSKSDSNRQSWSRITSTERMHKSRRFLKQVKVFSTKSYFLTIRPGDNVIKLFRLLITLSSELASFLFIIGTSP